MHTWFFPKIPRLFTCLNCSSYCLSRTENAYTHHTHNAYNCLGVDDWTAYYGVRHPPALPYSLRLFRFTSNERERGRGSVLFVLHPLSNIVIPLPLRRRLCFYLFFFFENFVSDCVLLFLCVASPHMPSFFSLFLFYILSRFASPRLASRFTHCFPQGDPRPLVVPYP